MKKDIIFSSPNLPIEITFNEIENNYTNWGIETKILYVVSGEIEIKKYNFQSTLVKNQFIILNPEDCCVINKKNLNGRSFFIEVSIDIEYMKKFNNNSIRPCFNCCLNEEVLYNEKYKSFRKLFISLIDKVINTLSKEKELLIFQCFFELYVFMYENFKVDSEISAINKKNNQKIGLIINYLEENYKKESLNVHEISEYIKLSPHYILKLFRANVGISLSDYLNELRIKKSIKDLLYTKKTILEISTEYGFSNSKSYHRVFKVIYGRTPKEYQREHFTQSSSKSDEEYRKVYSNIYEFINSNKINPKSDEKAKVFLYENNVDFQKIQEKYDKRYWEKIISIGKAKNGVNWDIQNQLKEIKKDFSPEYVRFTNILDDDMGIYNEDNHGNVFYNYIYIDKLIDHLVSLNLKPYINLGFMPKKIAAKECYIYKSNTNVSYPKKITKWEQLMINLIEHMIEKYGKSEVETWYFEIWNNSNFNGVFWYESNEKFFEFFAETFKILKNNFNYLQVGGPAFCFQYGENNIEWIKKFDRYMQNNNVEIDFFSFNVYGVKPVKKDTAKSTLIEHIIYDKAIHNSILDFYDELRNQFNYKKIIISEWNFFPALNLLNDTCYMNTFLIDSVLKSLGTVDNMVYWTFTENTVNSNLFYGGLGLFTTHSIKKSSYNAFLLLDKLGEELIGKGDYYIVTKKENSFQVLIYFHNRKALNELETKYNSYNEIIVKLNIGNCNNGMFKLTKYYLNKESGSAFERWKEMDKPQKVNKESLEYLKSSEKMKMRIEKIEIKDSTLKIEEKIESNGVIFLNFEKIVNKVK